MKKYHYVYEITNLNPVDERKYYIGVRTSICLPDDDIKYMGSSKYLNEAISNQGLKNFSKQILSVWETRELAIEEEIKLHKKFNVKTNSSFYNKANQLINSFTCDNTGKVTVMDLRDDLIKQVSTTDYKKYCYYEFVLKGKKLSREHIKKLSKAKKGTKRTLESRIKQSATMQGHTVNEKTKIKISEANSNKEKTQEHKNKIRETLKGTKQSTETKRKISLTMKGRKPAQSTIDANKKRYLKKFTIYNESQKIIFREILNKKDFFEYCDVNSIPANNLYSNTNKPIFISDIDSGNLKKFIQKNWFPKCKGWMLTIEEIKK